MPTRSNANTNTRTTVIPTVRVSERELERIKEQAEIQGKDLSSFVRDTLLASCPFPINPELLGLHPKGTKVKTTDGRAHLFEGKAIARKILCVHNYEVIDGNTSCETCSNLGVRLRE